MKVVLINGLACTGKTHLAEQLVQSSADYNLVQSVTTRAKRHDEIDVDHIFLSNKEYFDRRAEEKPVAETKIGINKYCAFPSQFKEDKINVYVVDDKGIHDCVDYFGRDNLVIVRLKEQFDCPASRKNRFEHTLNDDYCDLVYESMIDVNEIIEDIKEEL